LAKPLQEGRAWQVLLDVLQTGVAPLQSLFERQPTQTEEVVWFLHFGVAPLHAAQEAPQLASVLQTAQTPAPPQA
jgi:hypothetical protein